MDDYYSRGVEKRTRVYDNKSLGILNALLEA